MKTGESGGAQSRIDQLYDLIAASGDKGYTTIEAAAAMGCTVKTCQTYVTALHKDQRVARYGNARIGYLWKTAQSIANAVVPDLPREFFFPHHAVNSDIGEQHEWHHAAERGTDR